MDTYGKDSEEEVLVVSISEMGLERRFSLLKPINYFLSQLEHSRDFFNDMIAMTLVMLIPSSKVRDI